MIYEIFGLAIALGLIIYFLVIKKCNIGFTMIFVSIITIIIANKSIVSFILDISNAFLEKTTLDLLILVFLISLIICLMEESGNQKQIFLVLDELIQNSSLLLFFAPFFMGFMSVPGGALVSAPMIEEIDRNQGLELSSAQKTAMNIIAREIFHPIYPLYQTLIICASLTGISIKIIICYELPVVLISSMVAFFHIFYRIGKNTSKKKINKVNNRRKESVLKLLRAIYPLVVIVLLPFIFPISYIFSTIFGIIIFLLIEKYNLIKIYKSIVISFNKSKKILFAIIGIIIFRCAVMELTVLSEMPKFLNERNIPVFFILLVIPFLITLILGMGSAAIGLSLAIILPIIEPNYSPASIAVIFTATFCGYLISPMHLCLVLTREYFDAKLMEVYYFMLPVVATAIMCIIIIWFFFN